jgi:hypothetical protein
MLSPYAECRGSHSPAGAPTMIISLGMTARRRRILVLTLLLFAALC